MPLFSFFFFLGGGGGRGGGVKVDFSHEKRSKKSHEFDSPGPWTFSQLLLLELFFFKIK